MQFQNTTDLDDSLLHRCILRQTRPYRHDRLNVRFRYSRGADFSGTCFYREHRIHVNLGRRNRYPYTLGTNVAKARTTASGWQREILRLTVASPMQLALFVYLHELYHYLVYVAGRSPRQKEAMCDRFATGVLVDGFGCVLRDKSGRPVPRELWDFKDLRAFVSRAPQERIAENRAATAAIPVRILGG